MLKNILIVEDEPTFSRVLSDYLNGSGFQCHVINEGLQVESWVNAHRPDMILLDIQLPGINGFTLCQNIRSYSNVPIIMITGMSEEESQIQGLTIGADDYICKPFRPREVVARVNALFRRSPSITQDELLLKDVQARQHGFFLDKKRHRLCAKGNDIQLTSTQANLLGTLIDNEGRILTRAELILGMYPDGKKTISDRTIDSHIQGLRRHISQLLPDQEVIFSVYGEGYKFETPLL